MSRLIIDISELASWQGKLTGVPRVINELSMRFAANTDCLLVAWDGGSQSYQITAEATINTNPAVTHKPNNLARLSLAARRKLFTRKLLKSKEAPRVQKIVPKPGDVLFVMADWHGSDPAFVSFLIEQKRRGVKLVQICYDLLPIITPQYSGHATENLTRYAKGVYPMCDLILAISKHTKNDVTAWLKQNKLKVPPIEVIRLGDDFHSAKPTKPKGNFFAAATVPDFLLCVGTIEARKNHTLLYYAYKLANQKGIELPVLVVVGRRGWKTDDLYEVMTNDPVTRDKFIFLQSANDEELAWLYQHCQFSVYPSFYEGWGLPVAESVANGVPCISSDTSSMPEIAGSLINYFSPFSSDECLRAITELLKPGATKVAKARIKAYQLTTWDDTFYAVQKALKEFYA